MTTDHSMDHLMLDLETLGTSPGCSVFALGAVYFDPESGQLGPSYYSVISRHSCKIRGLREEPATMDFWQEQSGLSRAELLKADASHAPTLGTVLEEFATFMQTSIHPADHIRVWGNGAGFDQPILGYIYRKRAMDIPWHFAGERCFRTLKNLHPGLEPARPADKPLHHALYDTEHQARWALEIAASGVKLS